MHEKLKRNRDKPEIFIEIGFTKVNFIKKLLGYNLSDININSVENKIIKFIKFIKNKPDKKIKVKLKNEYRIEIYPKTFLRLKYIHTWRSIYNRRYKVRYFKCFKPYDHFVISWNGDIFICCSDYDGKSYMGNVFREDMLKILSNKRMQNFHKSLNDFKISESICATCKGQNNKISYFIYENYCKLLHLKFYGNRNKNENRNNTSISKM